MKTLLAVMMLLAAVPAGAGDLYTVADSRNAQYEPNKQTLHWQRGLPEELAEPEPELAEPEAKTSLDMSRFFIIAVAIAILALSEKECETFDFDCRD